MRKIVLFFTLLILSLSAPQPAHAAILHLELGAANYGPGYGIKQNRFNILKVTVRDLVAAFGTEGTIYLNDINKKGLALAVDYLRQWLNENGLANIRVEALPGNFHEIDLPLVETMHLSNPDHRHLPGGEIAHTTYNLEIVEQLERLATHSRNGLRLTTYFTAGEVDYVSNIGRYLKASVFKKIDDFGYEYHLPTGSDWRIVFPYVPADHTSTFMLIPRSVLCRQAY